MPHTANPPATARRAALPTARRAALQNIGVAAGLVLLGKAAAEAAPTAALLEPQGAAKLADLTRRLAATPRRRKFKTVPMILDRADQWDHEALGEIIAYRSGPKQVWDNTVIDSPWLNLMRNALNAQIWSFGHPDFLVVSATHGSAHLALFDQEIWAKYQLTRLAGDKFKTNTLLDLPAQAGADPHDYENPKGAFAGGANSIPTLQRRGVVFLACHNAIWEEAEKLLSLELNPDHLSHEALVAELTNHLIPGVVLTPGAVGTLPELQNAGFVYAK